MVDQQSARYIIDLDHFARPGPASTRCLLGIYRGDLEIVHSPLIRMNLWKYENKHIKYAYNWAQQTLSNDWLIQRFGPYHDVANFEYVVNWYLIADPEDILEFKFAFPDRI